MHHWKDKSKGKGKGHVKVRDADGHEFVITNLHNNLALLSYPCLMTADILSFNPDFIPVGEDQIQHLNFTNDIINELNRVTKNNVEFRPINENKVLQKIDEVFDQSRLLEKKR